jgi:hypothetical protein
MEDSRFTIDYEHWPIDSLEKLAEILKGHSDQPSINQRKKILEHIQVCKSYHD